MGSRTKNCAIPFQDLYPYNQIEHTKIPLKKVAKALMTDAS